VAEAILPKDDRPHIRMCLDDEPPIKSAEQQTRDWESSQKAPSGRRGAVSKACWTRGRLLGLPALMRA